MLDSANDDAIDPIDMYVGRRLRDLRKLRGLSQGYLGSCVGVSFQQIQKYELGVNRVSASKLAWFARMLGVSVQYFYQGLPTEYHGGGPAIAEADKFPAIDKDVLFKPETHDLICSYYALDSNKKRRSFLALLKSMISGNVVPIDGK